MNLYLFAIESIKQHRINTILFPEFRQNPKKNSKSDRTWKTNLVKIGTILKGFGEDWFSSNWSGSEPMWIELWRRIWGSNDDGSCDLAKRDLPLQWKREDERLAFDLKRWIWRSRLRHRHRHRAFVFCFWFRFRNSRGKQQPHKLPIPSPTPVLPRRLREELERPLLKARPTLF